MNRSTAEGAELSASRLWGWSQQAHRPLEWAFGLGGGPKSLWTRWPRNAYSPRDKEEPKESSNPFPIFRAPPHQDQEPEWSTWVDHHRATGSLPSNTSSGETSSGFFPDPRSDLGQPLDTATPQPAGPVAFPPPTQPSVAAVAPTPTTPAPTPTAGVEEVVAMGTLFSSGSLPGYLGVLPGALLLWTKIQETLQRLDSWWTSLSTAVCQTGCDGQGMPLQAFGHSPSCCPRDCPGYLWMCLRHSIIFLCILLLLTTFSLVYLDSQGKLPGCCVHVNGSCNCSQICMACTDGTCCCCCGSTEGCPACAWAFARSLWALALAHLPFLSSLQSLLSTLGDNLALCLLLLTWMTWYWGLSLSSTLHLFIMLYLAYAAFSASS
uniref:Large envelope protein n=1 Tax=Hepatitis B virus TaxID=10407 RepID=A0A8F3CIK9_HBV|nr:MAG: S protein [Hepatitis B virus]